MFPPNVCWCHQPFPDSDLTTPCGFGEAANCDTSYAHPTVTAERAPPVLWGHKSRNLFRRAGRLLSLGRATALQPTDQWPICGGLDLAIGQWQGRPWNAAQLLKGKREGIMGMPPADQAVLHLRVVRIHFVDLHHEELLPSAQY